MSDDVETDFGNCQIKSGVYKSASGSTFIFDISGMQPYSFLALDSLLHRRLFHVYEAQDRPGAGFAAYAGKAFFMQFVIRNLIGFNIIPYLRQAPID